MPAHGLLAWQRGAFFLGMGDMKGGGDASALAFRDLCESQKDKLYI